MQTTHAEDYCLSIVPWIQYFLQRVLNKELTGALQNEHCVLFNTLSR